MSPLCVSSVLLGQWVAPCGPSLISSLWTGMEPLEMLLPVTWQCPAILAAGRGAGWWLGPVTWQCPAGLAAGKGAGWWLGHVTWQCPAGLAAGKGAGWWLGHVTWQCPAGLAAGRGAGWWLVPVTWQCPAVLAAGRGAGWWLGPDYSSKLHTNITTLSWRHNGCHLADQRENMPTWLSWPCFHAPLHHFTPL